MDRYADAGRAAARSSPLPRIVSFRELHSEAAGEVRSAGALPPRTRFGPVSTYSRRRVRVGEHGRSGSPEVSLRKSEKAKADEEFERLRDRISSISSSIEAADSNDRQVRRVAVPSSPELVPSSSQELGLGGENFMLSSPGPAQLAELYAAEESAMAARRREEAELDEALDERARLTRCPLCGSELSDAVRDMFLAYPDSLRRSDAVCQAHSREAVLRSAEGKNYPTALDPRALEARAEKFVDMLADIVAETRRSRWHDDARRRAELRNGRRVDALAQMQEGAADALPGYYGLTGNGVLLRVALRHVAERIREASLRRSTRWITSMSATGYASAVLVPELATRLIMEDQGVDEAEAERIRLDSVEYGRILFADEDDYEDEGEESPRKHKRARKKKREPGRKKHKASATTPPSSPPPSRGL